MNESLLFEGEYPVLSQIEITSPLSYILILLFLCSIIIFAASWYYPKMKSSDKKYVLLTLFDNVIILSTISIVYIHSIIQEDTARKLVEVWNASTVTSDLVLRGFYISKIVPRFALIISFVVILSFIVRSIKRNTSKLK